VFELVLSWVIEPERLSKLDGAMNCPEGHVENGLRALVLPRLAVPPIPMASSLRSPEKPSFLPVHEVIKKGKGVLLFFTLFLKST